MTTRDPALRLAISDEVSDAIASGHGVVALESTIISHGLPTATSAATARQIEDAVRRGGAVPATVAVVDGTVRVGLTDDALVRVAEDEGVVKTSVRDLGPVARARADRRDHGRCHGVRRAGSPASGCSRPAGSAACTGAPATPGTSPPTWPRWRRRR